MTTATPSSTNLFFKAGSHAAQDSLKLFVPEDDLQLLVFLPSPPVCWDYRSAPPHPGEEVLRIEPKVPWILGKYPDKWTPPQPYPCLLKGDSEVLLTLIPWFWAQVSNLTWSKWCWLTWLQQRFEKPLCGDFFISHSSFSLSTCLQTV